ncbi:MAG: AraC family transcriptional regulator [Oscillospiraceae bacterium]
MDNTCKLEKTNVKFNDFRLCHCGYEDCEPLHSFGPSVKAHFVIHYVISGKGRLLVHGNSFDIKKGQAFLIEPNVTAFYEADQDDPWTYLWVGFDGEKARDYLIEMNLNRATSPVFSLPNGILLEKVVLEMLKHNTTGIENEFVLQSLLCKFFSIISSETTRKKKSSDEIVSDNYYIQKAQDFIRDNYSNVITVYDIANYVELNRSYLFTLFKTHLNTSPQKYLATYRLERSCELLKKSDCSIKDISIACGYSDALVFSKAFKKVFGVSPLKYRREC